MPKRGRYEHTSTTVALNKDPANVDSSEIESGGEEELDAINEEDEFSGGEDSDDSQVGRKFLGMFKSGASASSGVRMVEGLKRGFRKQLGESGELKIDKGQEIKVVHRTVKSLIKNT